VDDSEQDPHPGGRLLTGEGDPELDQRLSDELDAYNVVAAGAGAQRELTVRAEDEHGALVGGLSGWTWGTAAGIAMLWVHEDARRNGWGSRLLDAAEQVARERGCTRINVSSFTFQAPQFYARHGYEEVGRTEALPLEGQADVHFVKHLRQEPQLPPLP
jgi:GNAT superfamily N-acetyltransferase